MHRNLSSRRLPALLAAGVSAVCFTAADAADLYKGGLKGGPAPVSYNWTGFYAGIHSGAAPGTVGLDDPFGAPIYGDAVRVTGEIAGAQIGYNAQFGNLVAGVEADASWADLRGTGTCFGYSGDYISSNCAARIEALGTLTGRLGTTVGDAGRTLLYAKGGAAWESIKLTGNANYAITDFEVAGTTTSVNETKWGWTVGGGVERAITPRWSVKAEYNYMNFGDSDFTVPNSVVRTYYPDTFATATGPVTHYANDLHLFKLGTNYKFGGAAPNLDFEVASLKDAPVAGSLKDGPMMVAPSWEVEFGARYAGNWSRFQKDLGTHTGKDSLISRLTYENMWNNGGELFARIDTPQNIMIKGFVGFGDGSGGRMHDEDWVPHDGETPAVPYSSTISNIDSEIAYGTVDVGYDFFRGPGYKVAPFIGYTAMSQNMKAYGCTQLADRHQVCVPTIDTSVLAITEKDNWAALRLGSSIDVMIMPRLKLTAEAAWLPYVWFRGTDNHLLRTPPLQLDESGNGTGAQVEVSLSYAMTDNWNVGIGGRYSGQWTTSGSEHLSGSTYTQEQRFMVEQATGFAQMSYKLGAVYEPLK